jgi:multimeric flavodoxin WrbA
MAQINVVAFSSTPRAKGNSAILADEILKGAAEAGAATEKIRLHGLNIRPCAACNACSKSVAAPCIIKDDLQPLLVKMRSADAFVLASPIYFCAVNAQMKLFLDRWISLFSADNTAALRGKRMALAFAYGDKDPFTSGTINALRMFQDAAFALGLDLVGWVAVSCLNAGEVRNKPAALQEARRLGHKLATAAQPSRPPPSK